MLARVASALARSGLHWRVLLIVPIVAIALNGIGTGPTAPPSATRTASPSPSPVDELSAAKAAIQKAYEAEDVYKVDNLVYAAAVGDELAALKKIEPTVAWGTQVIVQLPNKEAAGAEVLILRAPLSNGESLCLSEVGEVADAGLYYARAGIGRRCPPYKHHMPGWTRDDQARGWRA
jgi:hypothetical protein